MRYAKAVDANHGEIITALRFHGFRVTDYSKAGGGVPDLRVAADAWFGRAMFWVEIKDGSKVPSERRLTDAQVQWRKDNPAEVVVDVLCVEDVATLARGLRSALGRGAA